MSIEIRVPQLPESVADATVMAWRKKPGEAVSRDENLADLETDKVVLDVPAPVSGVLREIKAPAGQSVKTGDLLAVIDEGASATAAPAKTASAEAASPAATAATTVPPALKTGPAARRVIEENQLAAGSIAASAPGGHVTKQDAEAAARAGAASSGAASSSAAPSPVPSVPTIPVQRGARTEQRVPMTRLRARIAERLVQAQATQALLTTFNEVDLGAVQELRARYKETFEKKHGVKLGFMSFFVRAVTEALKRFPVVNASVEDNDIVYHEYFDVGVAVSTERGLMVPILRDADSLSFASIEQQIGEFAVRARSGAIKLEELTGGTFSITNGGTFGSLLSTPIVNAPQSAILGMHKIQDRPMAVKGAVVVRPMMYLALTYDHRIIDGREAVQFLVTVKEVLEDPGRLLLGV
jgi:2-oxoglutarate dehydrogenase E2 component (dihydrolipoamide succinyltransferase)